MSTNSLWSPSGVRVPGYSPRDLLATSNATAGNKIVPTPGVLVATETCILSSKSTGKELRDHDYGHLISSALRFRVNCKRHRWVLSWAHQKLFESCHEYRILPSRHKTADTKVSTIRGNRSLIVVWNYCLPSQSAPLLVSFVFIISVCGNFVDRVTAFNASYKNVFCSAMARNITSSTKFRQKYLLTLHCHVSIKIY